MSSNAHSTQTNHSAHELDLDEYGRTALHRNARTGEINTVKALILSGASVNARDCHGLTPLHHAAWEGHTEVVEELLRAGSEVNAENESRSTPLHLSAEWGHIEIVNMLVREGARLDAQDENGRTPLHLSHCQCDCLWLGTSKFCRYYSDIITILINAGASLNITDNERRTPLHCCARHGWCEAARMLMNRGCEIDPVDRHGYTPLRLAKQNGYLDLAKLLREAKPFQHGDKTLYRLKETVKMFFGFSRTVEREEGGAVGGRDIHPGEINPEVLDNTDDDDEGFVDAPPTSSSTTVLHGSLSTSAPIAECVHHFKAIASSIEQAVLSQRDQSSNDQDEGCPIPPVPIDECVHHFEAIASNIEQAVLGENDQSSTDQDQECPAQCFHGRDENSENRQRHKCFHLYYTVNNYYSCSHEDEACRQLVSTEATSRIEEQGSNASTLNTSLETTRRLSFMTPSPQRAMISRSTQTTEADFLASIAAATPTSSSTLTSPLASTSLSSPTTVTSPLTTVPLSSPSTQAATASPSTSPTAGITSPSSGLVATTSPSAARSDLAETITHFADRLKTVLQFTPRDDQKSSTFAVDTSGSRITPLSLNVFSLNLNPTTTNTTTTNMHKPQNCAVSGNVNLIKSRKEKKTKKDEDSDDQSDESSPASEDEESDSG